jgi:hypothetical protein
VVAHDDSIGDYWEDQSALTAILHAMPQKMQAGLTVKPLEQEAWEAIRKIWLGADRVKEANVEQSWWEFGDLMFKPSESVEDSRFD